MKMFVVSLKDVSPFVSRVSYEKDDRDLKLYLSLQEGELAPENIVLEPASLAPSPIVENTDPKNKLAKLIGASWQEFQNAKLFLAFQSRDKALRERVLALGQGKEKGTWILFELPKEKLLRAKNNILSLLYHDDRGNADSA